MLDGNYLKILTAHINYNNFNVTRVVNLCHFVFFFLCHYYVFKIHRKIAKRLVIIWDKAERSNKKLGLISDVISLVHFACHYRIHGLK